MIDSLLKYAHNTWTKMEQERCNPSLKLGYISVSLRYTDKSVDGNTFVQVFL